MSTDNDHLLELIGKGDTLRALNQLYTDSAPTGGRLALNRALYGAAGDGGEGLLDTALETQRARLGTLDERDRATAIFNLGCIALSQDDVDEAILRFGEVLEMEPQHVMARHNLAYAHELMAETDEARREYEAVLAQNPASALTRLNLAQLKLQGGDVEAGVADLEALHRSDGDNMGVLLYLCRGLLERGGEDDLRAVLERLEASAEAMRYVDLQECRAFALFQLGDLDGAEQAFRQLLETSADNLFAITGMLKVLGQRNDYKGMKPFAERHQALDASDAGAAMLTDLAAE